jgi:hypothetical protein
MIFHFGEGDFSRFRGMLPIFRHFPPAPVAPRFRRRNTLMLNLQLPEARTHGGNAKLQVRTLQKVLSKRIPQLFAAGFLPKSLKTVGFVMRRPQKRGLNRKHARLLLAWATPGIRNRT